MFDNQSACFLSLQQILLKIGLKSLEKNSNHPLAKSIYNDEKDIFSVEEFKEEPGLGVKG